MVERVARAMAANEGYDPDETWEEFDRNAAATDMMNEDGVPSVQSTHWKPTPPPQP